MTATASGVSTVISGAGASGTGSSGSGSSNSTGGHVGGAGVITTTNSAGSTYTTTLSPTATGGSGSGNSTGGSGGNSTSGAGSHKNSTLASTSKGSVSIPYFLIFELNMANRFLSPVNHQLAVARALQAAGLAVPPLVLRAARVPPLNPRVLPQLPSPLSLPVLSVLQVPLLSLSYNPSPWNLKVGSKSWSLACSLHKTVDTRLHLCFCCPLALFMSLTFCYA